MLPLWGCWPLQPRVPKIQSFSISVTPSENLLQLQSARASQQGLSATVTFSVTKASGKLERGVHDSQDARPIPTGWPPTTAVREIDFVPPSPSKFTILVDLQVNAVPVRAVVDTAGQVTVISEDFYKQLPVSSSSELEEPIILPGAGKGSRMEGKFVRDLQLHLGDPIYSWT